MSTWNFECVAFSYALNQNGKHISILSAVLCATRKLPLDNPIEHTEHRINSHRSGIFLSYALLFFHYLAYDILSAIFTISILFFLCIQVGSYHIKSDEITSQTRTDIQLNAR